MIDSERDPIIERIALEARRPVAVDPDAKARLIAAVRAERSSGIFELETARARRISLSVGRFAALAAGLVGIGVIAGTAFNLGRDSQQIGQPRVVAASNPSRLPASLPASDTVRTFVIVAPGASTVSLVGDFNQWDATATPMSRIDNSDAWTVTVPLSRGRHVYQFYAVDADGEKWLADPHAPAVPDDGFGRRNSVILVGKGSAT